MTSIISHTNGSELLRRMSGSVPSSALDRCARVVGRARPPCAGAALLRFWPHHHVFGFFAAVASIEAFVQVDALARWSREDEAHAVTAAGWAGPAYHKRGGGVGLVGCGMALLG
jgi:hypothetical protein